MGKNAQNFKVSDYRKKEEIDKYSLKNVTVFKGHEGEACHRGIVCYEKENIGLFIDSPTGGEMEIRFEDPASQGSFYALLDTLKPFVFEKMKFNPTAWSFIQYLLMKHYDI